MIKAHVEGSGTAVTIGSALNEKVPAANCDPAEYKYPFKPVNKTPGLELILMMSTGLPNRNATDVGAVAARQNTSRRRTSRWSARIAK
jgi:hypothetical protein